MPNKEVSELNAPTIDNFVNFSNNSFQNPEQPSAALMAAMDPLFKVLAPLAPCKENDEAKVLWLIVPRGSIEDWQSFEETKEYAEITTYEEYEQLWKEYYPDENKWYRLTIGESKSESRFAFRNVAIDNNILINADLNNGVREEKWWKDDQMIELMPLLAAAAERSMDMVKAGTYNDYVAVHLPYWQRTGVIKRVDEWKAYPEAKNYVWGNMNEETYEKFLSFLPTNDEQKIGRMKTLTANDFFVACCTGYKACGYDLDGLSPVQAYLRYADGRDEGLTGTGHGLNAGPGIDLDSPAEWNAWYFDRKRGGGHPWEVIRGGNSTHIDLYVIHDENHNGYLFRSGQITEEEYNARKEKAGYYFVIAGKHRPWEAIRFFVALRQTGLPVILNNADEIAARYDGSDYIGIVPHRIIPAYCESLFPEKYGHVIDAMNIYEEDKGLLPYVEWLPEEKVELKD